MKRSDITDLFPEATKEQIDKLMGINGSDVNTARGDLDAVRTQLAAAQDSANKLTEAETRAANLQQELDGLKAAEAIRTMRDKVSATVGVPAGLLTGGTEEECTAQAQAILTFAKSNGYPQIADPGEVHVDQPKSTRDQFAEWFNSIQ